MNQENKPQTRFRGLKIAGGVILILLFLAGGLRLSLNTDWMRGMVKNALLTYSDPYVKGQLDVGQIEGDLWKSLRLDKIRLTRNGGNEIVRIDSLILEYRLFTLLSGPFRMDRLKLVKPDLRMKKDTTGRWNIAEVIQMPKTNGKTSEFYFEIEHLNIQRGEVVIAPSPDAPDSSYKLERLNLKGRAGYLSSGYKAQISEFRFHTMPPMLQDTVEFRSQAQYQDREFSLDKLILSTGQSLLTSEARMDINNNQFSFYSLVKPLSVSDVRALTGVRLKQKLDVEFSLEGSLSDFQVGLNVRAPALNRFTIRAGFQWDSLLALRRLTVNIQQLDAPALVESDSVMWPQIGQFSTELRGYMPIKQWETGRMEGSMQGSRLSIRKYKIDGFSSNLNYANRTGSLNVEVFRGTEKAKLAMNIKNASHEEWPAWKLDVKGRNLRPHYWVGGEMPSGSLNVNAEISGYGIMPGIRSWNFAVRFQKSRWMGQDFQKATLQGSLNQDSLNADVRLSLDQSLVTGNLMVWDYGSRPFYAFEMHSSDFNIGDIKGLQANTSRLQLHLQGRGSGLHPDNLKLFSRVSLDSSSVNKAFVDQLHAELQVQDTVLKLQKAVLKSEVASGSFSARQHLTHFYDRRNRLDFNMDLKNMQPLAPFADANVLKAVGSIRGKIHPSRKKHLTFDGSLDLKQIRYDSLLTIEKLQGTTHVGLKQIPYYKIEVKVSEPMIKSVVLQDLTMKASGNLRSNKATGSLELQMNSGTGAELQQQGNYLVRNDSVALSTQRLILQTPARRLKLKDRFQLSVYNSRVRMDTLRMASSSGQSFMELAVPRLDSVGQQLYLKARKLNMRAMQEVLFGRIFVGGNFSGHLSVDKMGSKLTLNSDMQVSQFSYENLQLDSVKADASIHDHRLKADIRMTHQEREILKGAFDIPFRLGKPTEFPDTFFDQQVQGYVEVNPIKLEAIEGAKNLFGFSQTKGTIRMRSVIRGTAGMPVVTGFAGIANGRFSGVPVDSAVMQVNYRHDKKRLQVTSEVISVGQKAVSLNANIPFRMDPRTWEVKLLSESHDLHMIAETNQFDLSAINEFISPDYVQNLKGRMDGKVILNGTLDDPRFDGALQLSNSTVMLPGAGVTYQDINGRLVFADKKIKLQQLSVNSRGSLQATGTFGFRETDFINMDLKVNANNFKVADTRDYRFFVNADVKLQGRISNPRIRGSMSLQRGFYYLPDFGEKSVEHVNLKSDSKESRDGSFMLYDSLDVTMKLTVQPDFSIRNKKYANMEVGVDGSVNLVKDKKEKLQLFGTINGRRGYIRTLGKRFEIEEGQMVFSGNPFNPRINMRFSYNPPQTKEQISIYYVITGTLEQPKFSYESEPPMGLENIVSYTLFGQPYYALNSWKQVVASPRQSGMASNLLTEALLNRIESLATRKLSVDVVEIQNNQSGSGGGTSIKTGWYLNENTFLAILNNISGGVPNTTFILEYQLKKNLELILRQGGQTREGIDLHWQKDY